MDRRIYPCRRRRPGSHGRIRDSAREQSRRLGCRTPGRGGTPARHRTGRGYPPSHRPTGSGRSRNVFLDYPIQERLGGISAAVYSRGTSLCRLDGHVALPIVFLHLQGLILKHQGTLQRLKYTPCLSMAPSSALRQGLHTTSMRPLARLEYEALSGAIRVFESLPDAQIVCFRI